MKSLHRSMQFFVVLLALAVSASACGLVPIVSTAFTTTTWYVTTGGIDSHDCLTPATACRTIDAVMTKATSGLIVIQVGPGTFQELTHTADPATHSSIESDGVYMRNRVLTLVGTVSGGTIQTVLSGQWGDLAVAVIGPSTVTLQDLILQNSGGAASRGLLVNNPGGGLSHVTVRNVIVQNNGGVGVEVLGNSQVTLDNVQVRNNGAEGVANDGGRLTIQNSRITDNHSKGVANSYLGSGGEIDLSGTTVSGNVGAGIANQAGGGGFTIDGSTISGTVPASAGTPAYGVYNAGGVLTLTNSTVSDNPIGVQTIADLTVSYSTIAGNASIGISAGTGGTTAPNVWIVNSIVENNSRQDCAFDLAEPRAAITLAGTVLSDGSCGPRGFGAYTRTGGSDTFLGSLADNGGPTRTQALLPGSLAIDAATGDCPAADQRGISRPQAAACDVGAYELQIVPSSLIIPAIPSLTVPPATPPAPTETPTPTRTPQPALSFGEPSISLDHFYYGKGVCIPTTLTLRVAFSNPSSVANMLLFFHLQDKAGGGFTLWNEGVSMTPLGSGSYEYTLASGDIPGFSSYPEALFLYQFVALGPDGTVVLRSDVFSNVTLLKCK
jgi:hypothetical protein